MQSMKVKTHPVPLGLVTNMEENANVLKIIKDNMSTNIQWVQVSVEFQKGHRVQIEICENTWLD